MSRSTLHPRNSRDIDEIIESLTPDKNAQKLALGKEFTRLGKPRTFSKRLQDAARAPEIRKLCGDIWFSGEIHILFADTGNGKSIHAVGIGDALSKGESYLDLTNEYEPDPLKVLLYDFELGDKQAEKRYSHELTGDHYVFSDHFYADTFDWYALLELSEKMNMSMDDLIFEKMAYDIKTLGIQVLIIDNITYLSTQTTQKTDNALDLMRRLNQLKKKYDLSILVIAHTPKIVPYTEISINDLAGSKHLSNFVDSVSAIGRSTQGPDLRYWKQIKPSRSGPLKYNRNNVIVCELDKRADGMLTFSLRDFDQENAHLNKAADAEDYASPQVQKVAQLLKKGRKYDEIAVEMEISKGTISKWKKKYPAIFSD